MRTHRTLSQIQHSPFTIHHFENQIRAALISLMLTLGAAPSLARTPMDTVHAFCRADGRGDRIVVRTWTHVAPYVGWGLEPAWDRVVLIEGYEVAESRYEDDDNAIVEVKYHVAADVEGGRVTREPREEKRAFRLVAADESRRSWIITGPPPAPHVFLSQADPDEMAASLDADSGSFLTSAAFIRKFLNGAGWELSTFTVKALPSLEELYEVSAPAAGDIVLYLDADVPYHLGVLESEDVVLSATLNGGIRRAPLDAFAGTVRYRRPRTSARPNTPTPAVVPTKAKKASGKQRRKR